MNHNVIKRLINEYLDGEIGLQDKAELERLMAENPALRKEYQDLRKIGLFLTYIPEVHVHPYRFRQRVMAAIDGQRGFFTPQRAFSMAMLVFLLVIGLTFGLFVYQQRMLSSSDVTLGSPGLADVKGLQAEYRFDLNTGVDAASFLNRIALEAQLGLTSSDLLNVFILQTRVFEGAVCNPQGGMQPLVFSAAPPAVLVVRVSPQQAIALAGIASDVGGTMLAPTATSMRGETVDLKVYISSHPGTETIPLNISFK